MGRKKTAQTPITKKTKPKKNRFVLNADGEWPDERRRFLDALRKVFRLHPRYKLVKDGARIELPPKTLKDGSVGKKIQVRYRCNHCKELFPSTSIEVDHIDPVVPVYRKESGMSYSEVVPRISCHINNLQVLCKFKAKQGERKSCHTIKSSEENFLRERWAELENPIFEEEFIVEKNAEFKLLHKKHLEDQARILKEKEERKRLRLLKKKK
jgi:hypothetical protein